jgi:hypothetical protein
VSERGSAASAEAVPVRRRHARVDHDPRPDREAPGPVGRRLPIVAKLGGVIGCFLVVLTIVAAVLLVELRSVTRSYDALDYFEKVGLPFVVAVNQFEGRPNLPLDQVRLSANVDPHVPVVAVDARSRVREAARAHAARRAPCPCSVRTPLGRPSGARGFRRGLAPAALTPGQRAATGR